MYTSVYNLYSKYLYVHLYLDINPKWVWLKPEGIFSYSVSSLIINNLLSDLEAEQQHTLNPHESNPSALVFNTGFIHM